MTRAATPRISVRNLQRTISVDIVGLEKFAQRAMKLCLELRPRERTELRQLPEIFVLIVSDRKIANLHRQFMNAPGATDVITFQHGEIFISADMARRNARTFGSSLRDELRLYVAHGLLHLHGFDDRDDRGRQEMETVQRKILAKTGALK
ncbi:MAG TPA: rRNA maturation RNase YbeY [Chthoniobacterales bacterium]|nr:rRNA maturation RNase YbeY [Chthoniobacterales bacterium]